MFHCSKPVREFRQAKCCSSAWLRSSRRRRGRRLVSKEPEFHRLAEFVKAGDRVLDVGANAGQYTLRLSELVGKGGK